MTDPATETSPTRTGAATIQDLVLTDEQATLRDVAREFLGARVPMKRVRELMATPSAFDERLWQEVAAMGWQAMAIPEDLGGAGYGMVEVAVLFEEIGRAVAPLPMLSTIMATAVLQDHGTDDQRATMLPSIAAGALRMVVAVPVAGADDGVELTDTEAGARLDGHASHVIEAVGAEAVVVATGRGAFVVPTDRAGMTVVPMDALDPTRPLARVEFANVAVVDDDALAGGGSEVIDTARTVGAVMLANEMVGVAAGAHAMAVEYAKVRRQFGRAIGSFQAVKHLLADDLVQLEAARSTAWWAARALAVHDVEEVAVAVPVAASLCPATAAAITGHSIQVHGGIGFTWEHDAHLYYKRASAATLLLGGGREWRRRLGATLALT